MRSLLVLAIAFLAVGCEKTTKPGPEPQGAPSTSGANATPATSKSGPVPDDPLLANVAPVAMPPESVTKPLAKGSNAFAFDLWQRIATKPGNATFSPASISIALAMTAGGAKGATATQMEKAMHFEGGADLTGASWGATSRAMTSPGRPLKLRIANRLYGEKTYKFEPAFLDKTKSNFGAPMELVDFKKSAEPIRGQINGWVENVTEKRIKDLLPTGAVNDGTRLVLVNAIYFLADWETQFEKNSTYDQAFNVTPTSKKQVPTMHEAGHQYRIAQGDGARVLELPYKGKSASMVFVLPDKVDGLAALEKSINAAKLDKWISELKSPKEKVVVALPRFEIAPPTIGLAEHLVALGMTDAFDAKKADFSGMGSDKDDRLSIGAVVHKAFVKVDEKGTEAAAATAVAMAGAGMDPSKPIEFFLDHPFLFFIVDRDSGLILFMGRVADPSSAG